MVRGCHVTPGKGASLLYPPRTPRAQTVPEQHSEQAELLLSSLCCTADSQVPDGVAQAAAP